MTIAVDQDVKHQTKQTKQPSTNHVFYLDKKINYFDTCHDNPSVKSGAFISLTIAIVTKWPPK